MLIRMLSDRRGADDGFTVRSYVAGKQYEIGGTLRADELVAVFLREGWAEKVVKAAVASPEPARDLRPVCRLPLLEEYVLAGYLAENYPAMIKDQTERAEAIGMRVEVRALLVEELEAEEAAQAKRLAAEAAPTPPTAEPTPAPEPPAAPGVDAPAAPQGKRKGSGKGR